MGIKRLQGLFAKAVIVLFIISMVPVLVIGYRTMVINNRLLKNELLQKQQMVGERLAFSISNALKEQEQILAEFGDLHTSEGEHGVISEEELFYLRQYMPDLFYTALLSPTAQIIFENGKLPTAGFESVKDDMLHACLHGIRFISEVYYDEKGAPYIWMAEPVHDEQNPLNITAVFSAAVYLDGIINALLQVYPLNIEAIFVAGDGNILSYNGAPEGVSAELAASLRQKLLVLQNSLQEADSAEVRLNDKTNVLASAVRVPRTRWHIYLFQSEKAASKLFVNSFFRNSLWDLVVILAIMILFVCVVSYLVIIPITRPLERLRNAIVKMRADENFVVQRQDVEIPNNEIGDVSKAFLEMSHALHQRRQELIKTQDELAHMNQVLEERVAHRTKELEAATHELVKTERLVAIGKMASIISHEIRNPLAVIGNATRLIQTLIRPKEQKVIKQFNVIEGEIRQANSIISEVLDYARTREMIFSTIDVNSYLRELVMSFPVPTHITVREELDPEGVRIKVDAEEIKQALRNIITNAVDAMPVEGTLTVGSKVGRRVVCIYVKDTGAGITEEIRQEMFSPFFTTKARGTGLGLAVVRKAIARHKGKLFISSELGKGTCFCIFLKIYRKVGDTNYGAAS